MVMLHTYTRTVRVVSVRLTGSTTDQSGTTGDGVVVTRTGKSTML